MTVAEKTRDALFADFCTFAQYQLATGDIDPAYPVLKALFDARDLDIEHRLWRLLLYVTYYSLGSAEQAWTLEPEPFAKSKATAQWREFPALPTGIERRGMRGNPVAVNRFLQSAYARASFGSVYSLTKWVAKSVRYEGEAGWREVREDFEGVWGVGSWASYKWADLLKNVLGMPITANDIGLGGGSKTAGPVPGLALLTGENLLKCATNETFQRSIYGRCLDAGVPFTGLDQFETVLCDFNSLAKGHYYVGHDIDLMVNGLAPHSTIWAARKAVFLAAHLGELGNWSGVRPERLTVYRDEGVVLHPSSDTLS